MRSQGRIRSGARPVPVAWLDPVASSPIEVAAGGLIVTALGLLGMIWGAAVGSSWWVNGDAAEIGVSDAALAMARFGQNGLAWEGAWSPAVEDSLAGPSWFWAFFAAEVVLVALLFWPMWRLFGPRPADPMPVIIEQTPAKHPRTERRKKTLQERTRKRRRVIPVPVAPRSLAPAVDKILVSEPSGHQVVLGRAGGQLVTTNNFHSVIVFGPTQSGKTSALTVPAVLDWDGPALVVSAKPDLISHTWRERAGRGGRTWLFDPMSSMAGAEAADATGRPRTTSHGWSPLDSIDAAPRTRNEPELNRRVQQWGRARRSAQWMVGAARRPRDQGAMPESWFVAAEQMLAPLLLAAAADELTIGEVAQWVDRRDTAAVAAALERAGVVEAQAAWDGAARSDEATRGGAYQLLSLIMFPYGDPRVLSHAQRPDISAGDLLDGEPNTLYALAPPNHRQRLRPLLAALVSEMLDTAMGQATGSPAGRLRSPLLVVLDDAPGAAPLPLLDQLASVGAGLGIQLLSVFQDLGHIEETLGTDGAIALANDHRARVILPGVNDAATLNYVHSLIRGNRLVGSTDFAADEVAPGEPVVIGAPNWMRTLHDGDAICVYGNLPPVRMALRPWFADRSLRDRVEPPAERLGWWARRRRDAPLGGTGFPNPLDSEANDREAARYWESVLTDGNLPQPRAFDDGSGSGMTP